jgi:hypothetical protein
LISFVAAALALVSASTAAAELEPAVVVLVPESSVSEWAELPQVPDGYLMVAFGSWAGASDASGVPSSKQKFREGSV